MNSWFSMKAPAVVAVLVLGVWPSVVPAPAARAASQIAPRTAQLPRYSASGLHECDGKSAKRSCVVTGLFTDCNDATIALQTRDCCPTTAGGGASSRFTLTYCIPDYSGR